MKRKFISAVVILLLVLAESFCSAAVRRFALISGANRGGATRTTLRYAQSDAEAFAKVLQELAGVAPEDCRLLRDPSLADFEGALQSLRSEIEKSRQQAVRVELIFYYSGHADDQALMLGSNRLPYEKIREEMALLKADVNLAILDACASGAITRLKGGVRHPAFLTHSGASMRGYAFLTSSSENETAQESDRIRASFFTYYLISALRGAADSNADGRVSLNEAYDFSYNETLGRTAKTQGGPQHPAYDIQLAGTGELIITDVREMSSTLVLPQELGGRFYVMNAQKQLIAELFKPAGRKAELGLDKGTYLVYLETGEQFLAASLKLGQDETIVLEKALFIPAKKEPSVLRGPSVYSGQESFLSNRSRLEVLADLREENTQQISGLGLAYSYYVREDLALRFSAFRQSLDYSTGVYFPPDAWVQETGDVDSTTLLLGVRYNPFRDTGTWVKPYLWGGFGPALIRKTSEHRRTTSNTLVQTFRDSSVRFCVQPGAGVDFFVKRRYVFTVHGAYNVMESAGVPDTRKWQLNVGFGVLLGRGTGK